MNQLRDKSVIIRLIFSASAFLFLNGATFAAECSDPTLSLMITVADGQKFFSGSEADLFQNGEGVRAIMKITNLKKDFVAFPMASGMAGPLKGTKVDIRSREGRLISLTGLGKVLFNGLERERTFAITSDDGGGGLKAGETTEREFRLDNYYRFYHAGSYSVSVSEPDPKNSYCDISSNTATFATVK